jgi:hypothetical protein
VVPEDHAIAREVVFVMLSGIVEVEVLIVTVGDVDDTQRDAVLSSGDKI